MLDSIPLFTSILGVVFLIMILVNGGALKSNAAARNLLIIILLLGIHTQVDAWLYYNGFNDNPWVGLSFLHYHLMGGLFLFLAFKLFKIPLNTRLWRLMLIGYTIFRTLVLIPIDAAVYENYSEIPNWADWGLLLDNFISNGLNIAGLLIAYRRVKGLSFSVRLSNTEKLNYLWLKNLLLLLFIIYIAVLANTLITLFYPDQWLTFWKLESLFLGLLFIVLAFFAIRFPVFSVYGDFKDLVPSEKKYANSSLTADISGKIWQELNQIMQSEKPYLNPDYRLNDLAARVDQSLHHVSQVINENEGISFSDFINRFRVKEAQQLLRSDRAKEITILAIALEAGFNSKTAFYNTFKKVTGQTPSQYMRDQ